MLNPLKALTISSLVVISLIQPSFAQRGGGTPVSTAFVEEMVISDTTKIPGAVIAPPAVVIPALRADIVKIEDLKVGDFIRKGSTIASQNVDDLQIQLELLALQIADTKAQITQTVQNLSFETEVLAVAEQQLQLAMQRSDRAQMLAQKKAISAEAAETALSSLLNNKQQVISRKQSIERLKANQDNLKRSLDRLNIQKSQLENDIADGTYAAPVNGLIISLPSYRSGFARQGEVIASIQGFRGFEVQVEVPSAYIGYLQKAPKVVGIDGQGNSLELSFRTSLPQEDIRTSTRPARFTIESDLPRATSANGARIDVQIPIREALPSLVVPQDAILPVPGGHVVFVFNEGKAQRQIVRLGGTFEDKVIIQTGLAVGERVIIKGNEGLTDGMSVKEGKPPTRKKPNMDEETTNVARAEEELQTELADDAVKWLLEWKTRRGDSSGELTLSSKANLFDGEPIRVQKTDNKIAFDAELVLPFGILTLSFDGTISDDTMSGMITMSGLPNGNTPTFPFSGKVM